MSATPYDTNNEPTLEEKIAAAKLKAAELEKQAKKRPSSTSGFPDPPVRERGMQPTEVEEEEEEEEENRKKKKRNFDMER